MKNINRNRTENIYTQSNLYNYIVDLKQNYQSLKASNCMKDGKKRFFKNNSKKFNILI